MWAAELFGGDSGYRGGSALSIVAALMPWQMRVQLVQQRSIQLFK